MRILRVTYVEVTNLWKSLHKTLLLLLTSITSLIQFRKTVTAITISEIANFNPEMSPSYLYFGNLGFIIGHEITHSYSNAVINLNLLKYLHERIWRKKKRKISYLHYFPQGPFTDQNGIEHRWRDNVTLQNLINSTICIKNQFARLRIPSLPLYQVSWAIFNYWNLKYTDKKTIVRLRLQQI